MPARSLRHRPGARRVGTYDGAAAWETVARFLGCRQNRPVIHELHFQAAAPKNQKPGLRHPHAQVHSSTLHSCPKGTAPCVRDTQAGSRHTAAVTPFPASRHRAPGTPACHPCKVARPAPAPAPGTRGCYEPMGQSLRGAQSCQEQESTTIWGPSMAHVYATRVSGEAAAPSTWSEVGR